MQKILVIDDDRDMCLLLKKFLGNYNFNVSVAYSSKQALEILEIFEPDLVLCDFRLDINDGKTMLVKIKSIFPTIPVIIITAYTDMKIAVEVMKLGAYDYITKPIIPEEIILTIQNALKETKHQEKTHLHDDSCDDPEILHQDAIYLFEESQTLKGVLHDILQVAPTNKNIIIYGESGTGKQVIAEEIHKRSERKNKPFVCIDCRSLSKDLAGTELFGHEKGAFSGAVKTKIGNFEQANGGTVFLDEITNLSYELQLILLKLINDKKFRRVGGNNDINLDVRIIVACNEKLPDACKKGKFSEELFNKLNECEFNIPPLRERKKDIMLFANHFLKMISKELNKAIYKFSAEVQDIFTKYVWYGNLRELKNIIKRAALITDGDCIEVRSLPFEISNFNKLLTEKVPSISSIIKEKQINNTVPESRTMLSETTLKGVSIDAEYEMILEALKQTNFNKSKAAKFLHIDRKTLYNKMKQYQQLNNH